ncbi:MAG: family 43 glycosylhydrolase [Lachnospiraceae bacterium]|nr:family 43 glycosylhydrolase [Lachnospiraceae bacterium]
MEESRIKKQALNPYLPSYEYVPDGEPRVFGDRVYVYGSHDRFDGPDFCVNDYVCWSAPVTDLADWKYEGVIYKASQDKRNAKGNMHMCAPDVVQGPDGRFYLYYEFHRLTVTSVAVCDTPAGKYEFYGYVQRPNGIPYGEKKGEVNLFDPGVLVDNDGRIWMYTGFSPLPGWMKTAMSMRGLRIDGGYCVELEKDMITMKGEPVMVLPGPEITKGTGFEGHGFFEASSIRKIGDVYYLVYSSELSHELCYATSKRPDGGYSYGGTLVSIGDIGYKGNSTPRNYTGNTHGGMACINGQWYIFYHRQTNKQKCARQGCAEKLTILPDGSIPQAEVTSCGLNAGPLSGTGVYEARIACNLSSREGTFAYLRTREKDKKRIHPYFTQSGGDREKDGDQYIANMTDGSVAGFKYFAFSGQEKTIRVNVRGTAEGLILVTTEQRKNSVAEIPIRASEQFQSFTGNLTIDAGVHTLFFRYVGKGALDFAEFEIR